MAGQPEPLKIVHILRAPVGGLFRHVRDLVRGQSSRGHKVGIVADSSTGGSHASAAFAALAGDLALGLVRVPMSRSLGRADVTAARSVASHLAQLNADVAHGHGAKGGAYARLTAPKGCLRVYTPHGGSLHYRWGSPAGAIYLMLERVLMSRTDLFLFESQYGLDAFRAKIGSPRGTVRVVHNGVAKEEFEPITPEAQASDIVFVGELRALKGVDVLIDAIAQLAGENRRVTATIVGDGPDAAAFRARVAERKLEGTIRFAGILPARTAFARGRIVAVPSRAESLPYIVLEAAAAGLPLVATNVGGIPEIFGPDAGRLIPPGDTDALARAIASAIDRPGEAEADAARLRERVASQFSAGVMVEAVLAAYREALREVQS